MSKKIIAIGGGTIGEYQTDGVRLPYETLPLDEEIVRLSNCSKPNLLFIGLADIQYSKIYFELINEVFGTYHNCQCRNLDINSLTNKKKISDYFSWSDIIYVGGGNTYTLIKKIREYGLDENLNESYEEGKVMSGLSAGGMCYFKYGTSAIPNQHRQQLIKQDCLGFQPAIFAPHADEINGHFENMENMLRGEQLVGISLSNCAAIEIIDDKYRIITAQSDRYKIAPFAIKSYWLDGKYYTENIPINDEYVPLDELLAIKQSGENVRDDVKKLLKRRNIYFNKE